jgi:1,4-alpha-glucan branching enzyme
VNAAEFMPLNEFEGTDSWGYNPKFHGAIDKAYGPPENIKGID